MRSHQQQWPSLLRLFLLRFRCSLKSVIISIICSGLLIVYYQSTIRGLSDHNLKGSSVHGQDKILTDGLSKSVLSETSPSSKGYKIVVLNIDPKNPDANSKLSSKNQETSCNLPKLSKSSPEIEKSYKKPLPLRCERYPEHWLYLDAKKIPQLTDYAKSFDQSQLTCSAAYFYRETDNSLIWKHIPKLEIGTTALTDGDFISVNCTLGTKKWKHLFMQLSPIPSVIEASKSAKRSSKWSGLSVYWFSFDSLSQQAFRRLLPKTIDYLENVMGSVVMNGYNIVGDGTPQAFIPILTGKTELELPLTRKRYPEANYVDVYPWVWKNLSEAGYVTLYAEDAAAVGTFTYRLKGFNKQPTDHYTRTFFVESEKFFKKPQCFGRETQFDVWARYGADFLKSYPKDVPKFAVFHHGALSHDSATLVTTADDAIAAHFKELHEGGFFDDTVVFVGADHGHRFAAMRETQQGQLEERLPFLGVYLPSKFRSTDNGKAVYANLKANADRLTSPFDIYATLLDVLELPEDLTTNQDPKSRSMSLFRPIPKDRTCEQAGIEPHWCTCLSWQASEAADSALLAGALIETINNYTKESRKLCAEIKLDKIVESKRLVADEKVLKYGGVKDADGFVPDFKGNAKMTAATYMLTFTTTPGNARYEATVLYDSKNKEITIDMLSISHVNKYGLTPHCIIDTNYFLAAYCVCYDKI
uniref:Uncharacterized protein n=1 Tax=Panagrellus redivivus TaxID=6233 RepID=A0A7E4VT59_PANRE